MNEFTKEIFDILVRVLPSDWGKIVLRVFVGPNSQMTSLFVQDSVLKKYYSYIDLVKMGLFTKQEYQSSCIQIGKVSREHQKSFEKPWTGYTLLIARDGKVDINYEYDPPSTGIPEEWINRYLK